MKSHFFAKLSGIAYSALLPLLSAVVFLFGFSQVLSQSTGTGFANNGWLMATSLELVWVLLVVLALYLKMPRYLATAPTAVFARYERFTAKLNRACGIGQLGVLSLVVIDLGTQAGWDVLCFSSAVVGLCSTSLAAMLFLHSIDYSLVRNTRLAVRVT